MVKLFNGHLLNLTTKPEMSVCLFVPYLLCRLRADGHQTWQEGQGWAQKTPRGTLLRNLRQSLVARNATFLSVCAGESQAGNPIGSALVLIIQYGTKKVCETKSRKVVVTLVVETHT